MRRKDILNKVKRIRFEPPICHVKKTARSEALKIAKQTDTYHYTEITKEVKKGEYPCPYCEGMKKFYDSNDCDPHEGYKMAHRKIPCSVCNGNGFLPEEEFCNIYNTKKNTFKEEKKQYEKQIKILHKLFDSLTDDEWVVLHNHFNKNYWGEYIIEGKI